MKGNLNDQEKVQKNLLLFHYQLKKNLIMVKQLHTRLKFIDSFRFVSTSLSSLVDNLLEGLHSVECMNCKSCLDYTVFKDGQLIFRCFECKKN